MEECHKRGVKSCFSSPYKPQQDYAEGYIGRITTMASFAMVLSGAPLWMWRWAIQCGAFINNITATHYRKEGIWGTPWELQHGEPFPDSSIVVPFGCGALVMLTREEREKFRTTCAMMIFSTRTPFSLREQRGWFSDRMSSFYRRRFRCAKRGHAWG